MPRIAYSITVILHHQPSQSPSIFQISERQDTCLILLPLTEANQLFPCPAAANELQARQFDIPSIVAVRLKEEELEPSPSLVFNYST